MTPRLIVNALAPVRICDLGGWTDTWFAGHGCVFNIAVHPSVEVQIEVYDRAERDHHIVLEAENYGDRYAVGNAAGAKSPQKAFGRHPLLEAAITHMRIPENIALVVNVSSEVPAGASTGTSAAVTVAMIAALNRVCDRGLDTHGIAATAHHVEYNVLGMQCGVQDQYCSAWGGINLIEIDRFPGARIDSIDVPSDTWSELERRLVLVYLGSAHSSSEVHRRVIASLEREGGDIPVMHRLRRAAVKGRDAVLKGDFAALGEAMIANTEAQRELHEDLISADAHTIIDIGGRNGAAGWKVNGAGGEGGSLTLLSGASASGKRDMIRTIRSADPKFTVIPIRLSRHGVRVWES